MPKLVENDLNMLTIERQFFQLKLINIYEFSINDKLPTLKMIGSDGRRGSKSFHTHLSL